MLKMKGTVVSITPNYGFIRDGEGISYYFSPKSMKAEEDYPDVKIGSCLEFEPQARPKGMAAQQATIIKTFTGYEDIDGFVTVRDGHQSPAGIAFASPRAFQTQWYRSHAEAIENAERVVKELGGNAMINTRMMQKGFQEGNYHFSMFSLYVEGAIAVREVQMTDEGHANASWQDIHDRGLLLNEKIRQMAEWLDKQRKRQEDDGSTAVKILFLGVIAVVAFMYFFG